MDRLTAGLTMIMGKISVASRLKPPVECIDKTTGLRARGEQSVSEIDYAVKEITGASAPHFQRRAMQRRRTRGIDRRFCSFAQWSSTQEIFFEPRHHDVCESLVVALDMAIMG